MERVRQPSEIGQDYQQDRVMIELLPTKTLKSIPKAAVKFGSTGEIVIGGNRNIEIISSLVGTSAQDPINERELIRNVWGEENADNIHSFTACVNSLHSLISKLNLRIWRNNIPYEIVRNSNGKRLNNLEVLYYLHVKQEEAPSFVVFPSGQSGEYEDD